jgi:myo-inositol 2-dehydrogenase/D-chiro-inositol 1-dehydrogenase
MAHHIRLGVVGTGRIGRVHIQTITQRLPQARIAVVTDVNQQAAAAVAEAFGIARVAPDYDAMLADDQIDAVLICSGTDTHADFIIKAAQAHKHIFCEKPIAAELSQIDAALQAVEAAGVQLMIGFNRRFDANHQRIRAAIDAGEIGTPHLLHIISRDPSPPPLDYVRVSGGMFFDMTIHDFDMARFLFGEVTEIYATAGVLVDPAIGEVGDVDTAVITLKFASGAMGTIDNSRQAVYGYDQRVEAFGSEGVARSDNLFADAVTLSNRANVYRGLPLNFFMERYTPSYQAEIAAFVECLLTGQPMPVTGIDGRIPVLMAMAARRSYHENRPVRLDEILNS